MFLLISHSEFMVTYYDTVFREKRVIELHFLNKFNKADPSTCTCIYRSCGLRYIFLICIILHVKYWDFNDLSTWCGC